MYINLNKVLEVRGHDGERHQMSASSLQENKSTWTHVQIHITTHNYIHIHTNTYSTQAYITQNSR